MTTAPSFQSPQFSCPFCGVYSSMHWAIVHHNGIGNIADYNSAFCLHCKKTSLWVEYEMVFPVRLNISPPNIDLTDEIKADYIEAAKIMDISPRGSAALLRLALQKLCVQLGLPGKNINDDIAQLVSNGLNVKIQKALDTVRVVGNNAVHPGQIDLKDNKDIVIVMFKLLNQIAYDLITSPKEVDKLYDDIVPDSAKEAIKKRDA